ncbi:hypothetical protein [Kaarinaea lacus]
MGHNAFVERYDRPNYKLHVIIFLAITGISIVLATQVEKSRDKTDIAALKAPVPIDSIAIDGNLTSEQISPSVKPPVAENNPSADDTRVIAVNVDSSQEYSFEDSASLENIDAQLVAVSSDSGADVVVESSETTVAATDSVLEDTVIREDEVIKTDQAGESVVSLDQVFQQQHDRFLQTLAKTAETETKESEEIKQLKEAIRSDKPLAAGKSQSVKVITSASEESAATLNKKHIAKAESDRSATEQKRSIVKQKAVKQVANVRPASQQLTSGNAPQAIAMQTRLKTSETIVMTKGELDRVVNQFTNSYNEGDINRLMALFAENARTNDQQNKPGIKADYAELFNNTKYRKLMINDINWQLGKGKAEGAAEFVVTVQPKNGLEENSIRGHIKITAIKHSKGVYITRLLHELKQ